MIGLAFFCITACTATLVLSVVLFCPACSSPVSLAVWIYMRTVAISLLLLIILLLLMLVYCRRRQNSLTAEVAISLISEEDWEKSPAL